MRLTLGGIPLGTVDFAWSLKSGVTPETRVVEVSTSRANKIKGLGPGPHELVMSKSDGGQSVQGVYVLGEQPGDSPHTRGLLLADSRWLWPRKLVVRSYNVRRRTGKRRALGTRAESADLVDDVAYAPWSLKAGGQTWTARDVLEDVLTEIHPPGFRLPAVLKRDVPIEDLDLSTTGENALLRVLQYLPGYSVYVDYDGRIVVYDTRDEEVAGGTRTRDNPTGLGKAHVGTGHAFRVDKRWVRPSRVDVYFVPEVEVRFNYAEDSQFTTQSRNREDPTLENVAPLPEWELDVDGVRAAQGEWHKIGDAATTATSSTGGLLQAFEDNNPANATARSGLGVSLGQTEPLSLSIIRKYYFPGLRSLLATYAQLAQGAFDAVWLARVQTILQHYRLTFRILPKWLDKVRSVRAYRVGVIDSETGGRAPSQVWTDYTAIPEVKGIVHRESDREGRGWLVSGYNADLASAKAGPFRVDVFDQDQGLLRIEPRSDPWGYAQSVIPGHPDKTPSMDLRRINNAELADTISATWGGAGLAASWQLSTVLTVIPASPNGLKRLYKRSVRADQVPDPLPAEGPPASVFIGPGVMTAMFGWDDAQAEQIKEVFWGSHAPGEGTQRWDNVDGLLVNEDHVQAVAEAAAARLYELYQDRYEGSYRGPLNTNAVPSGSMRTVTHQLKWTGSQTVAGTLYQMPPITEPIDLEPFLPETVKQVVLRTAQP